MGTWAEWTHVLADAGYSAVFMFILIWGLNRRGEDGSRQNLLTFVAAFYFGAAYGLQHTFQFTALALAPIDCQYGYGHLVPWGCSGISSSGSLKLEKRWDP